jgi:Glycosyl transferase family 2
VPGYPTVGVIVATFGDQEKWKPLAVRALRSAQAQTISCDTLGVHSDTLAYGRNYGASRLDVEWLIFLDADDELDPHYIEHMIEAGGDVRQPSTLGVYSDGSEDEYPVLIPPNPGGWLVGNHVVIGAMVRHSLFDAVGGFRELPVLEDWDLWIRCAIAGAEFGTCPEAIYRVHVNPDSRNQNHGLHNHVYAQIQSEYVGQL